MHAPKAEEWEAFWGAPAEKDFVFIPSAPGQHQWTATSPDGIWMRVTMQPGAPRSGDLVTLTVEHRGRPDEGCCSVALDYGADTLSQGVRMGWGPTCPTLPGVGTDTFPHIWNKPQRAHLSVFVGAMCSDRRGDFFIMFDVPYGKPPSSQGPLLPKFGHTVAGWDDPCIGDMACESIWTEVADDDGYLTRLVVDWGNGTAPTTVAGSGDVDGKGICYMSKAGWPNGTSLSTPHPSPYHRFAKPGTYTQTLTAFSTGCDGKQQQRASTTLTWAVPEPLA